MAIKLDNNNYYSEQANKDYMSVSQFKDFAGTLMHASCEDTAYKKANNLIQQITTKALLVGSYVDAFYEGTLDKFKSENRENICTKASIKAYEKSKNSDDLQMLADFKLAETVIEKTTGDPLFTKYMSGEKQTIMTATLFGIEWKIKMDSYHPGEMIVDLKVMRSMDPIWSDKNHMKSDFIRYYGYDIQGAIYQKVVEIVTGKKLPFFIACATKEDPTNIEIIQIDQNYLDDAIEFVKQNIDHVLSVKNGKIKPNACGTCYWCRKVKTLSSPIHMQAIVPAVFGAATEEADILDSMAPIDNTESGADETDTTAEIKPFHLFETE